MVSPLQFPFVLPQMHLVITFEVDPSELGKPRKLEITFRDADGQGGFTLGGNLEFPKPQLLLPGPVTANHIVALQGLPFPKAGDYQFAIAIDGDVKETITVRAMPRPQSKS